MKGHACANSDASQCKGVAAMTCTVRVCLSGEHTIEFSLVRLIEKEDVHERQFVTLTVSFDECKKKKNRCSM